MAKARTTKQQNHTGANLGFEAKLWQMADGLRNNMDAAEYKHVVLGLIFLKYISDAFEEHHAKLESERKQGADPEDADEYRAAHIFWVPKEARWSKLKASAPQPTIGKVVDDAMVAIERDNPSLKGVLPKDYARPGLDKERLGQLINLVSNIGLGDKENRSKGILGRVYEYFLSQFASAEGKKGGQFYTPRCVVRVLVEMLAPYKGRVYDPCCGSGGMFVQSEQFIEAHGGKVGQISIYGQESNYTTWRLAVMNLALRGIDAQIARGDTFHNHQHPDLKADYVLANPPFNDSDWRGELLKDDKRWKYGTPPTGNANFAWVQHFIHHLAPTGIAGFVLANGSMSSNQSGEGEIRKAIIEADVVDCMVAMPGQLFYSTQIPVCLWFIARDKKNGRFRDRRGEVLFIDARKLGSMIDRVHRELTDEDIAKIAGTYHAWRGAAQSGTSGTGVSPVESYSRIGLHAQDARATIKKRYGAYLPHWTRDESTYAVNFRLSDSLPDSVVKQWRFERDDILKTAERMNRPLSDQEAKRLDHLFSERIESYLDAGHGQCWLRQEKVAELVAAALRHFDEQRYRLIAWTIMPNHVHVVFRSLPGYLVPDILHSWKSYTSKEAAKLLNTKGEFWQTEYYDHLIRDEEDFAHAVEYVLQNPMKAGLKNWKWVWVDPTLSDGGTSVPPVGSHSRIGPHAQDARATYQDIPGFCKAVTLDDIRKHGHVLTPGRYVGAEAAEDDGEPFEEKMKRLTATLREQQAQAAKLDTSIRENLAKLGFPVGGER